MNVYLICTMVLTIEKHTEMPCRPGMRSVRAPVTRRARHISLAYLCAS